MTDAQTDVAAGPTRSEPLLALRGLIAGYDGVSVVHDLDLTVGVGEVVALVGANGAGKTTTLLTVSGLVPALDGSIEVLGEPVRRRRSLAGVWGMARKGLAHVPEDRGLFFDLTAAENLRLGTPRRGPASTGMWPSTGSRLWPRCWTGRPGCSPAASSRCWPWPGLSSADPACCWSTR
ncbi:hypothetical protein BH24ACT4_BH24ACT4_14230 [soil metagenome]